MAKKQFNNFQWDGEFKSKPKHTPNTSKKSSPGSGNPFGKPATQSPSGGQLGRKPPATRPNLGGISGQLGSAFKPSQGNSPNTRKPRGKGIDLSRPADANIQDPPELWVGAKRSLHLSRLHEGNLYNSFVGAGGRVIQFFAKVNYLISNRNILQQNPIQDEDPASRPPGLVTLGQGIDACALYPAGMVLDCRMGFIPEPNYEIVFFGGSNPDEGSATESALMWEGPPPEIQTPIWAAWATQTYRYPGVYYESTQFDHDPANIDIYRAKEGQAARANEYNQQLPPNTYIIVVGYSAGGDAALMFASRYNGTGQISDVIMIGPTMSGGLGPEGLEAKPDINDQSRSNISDNGQWQGMIQELLDRGIDVYVYDDAAGEDPPDYPDFQPTGNGTYTYVKSDASHWDVTPSPGTPAPNPMPSNQSSDLLMDVIDWIHAY